MGSKQFWIFLDLYYLSYGPWITGISFPWGLVRSKLNVVLISPFSHLSNHYVVHLKLIPCYMSILSQ